MTATVIPLGPRSSASRHRRALVPFTVPHFKVYASRLVFDDGVTREPEDWQLDHAREVFRGIEGGATALDVGESWLIVPEGNGKTTWVAELALYGADWAVRPWIPVGASSRDQAKTLYTQAKGFVDSTPGLKRRFQCFDGYRSILPIRLDAAGKAQKRPGRGIEITPWDPASNDGVIPYPFFVCDELHRHPDMSLWRLWKGKARKRGAVGIGISTAGEPGTEFEEARDRIRQSCRRVRRAHGGTLYRGGRMSMWEYRLADPEKAMDPNAVAAVNPLSSNTPDGFAEELNSPTLDMGDWKRLKCNIPARSTFAAITDDEWAGARSALGEIPEGVHVDCGLDVAWKQDDTALASLWTPTAAQLDAALRSDQLRRLNGHAFKLLDEVQVETPPRDGSSLHPDAVKALLFARMERNPIDTLVMDTSKAEDIAAWADDELGVIVVDRGQSNDLAVLDYDRFMTGIRISSPFRKDVKGKPGTKQDGKVIGYEDHLPLRIVASCPKLTRYAMNAIGRRLPRGDIRFDRPTSSRSTAAKQDVRTIDGLTASCLVVTNSVKFVERNTFDLGAYRVQRL